MVTCVWSLMGLPQGQTDEEFEAEKRATLEAERAAAAERNAAEEALRAEQARNFRCFIRMMSDGHDDAVSAR